MSRVQCSLRLEYRKLLLQCWLFLQGSDHVLRQRLCPSARLREWGRAGWAAYHRADPVLAAPCTWPVHPAGGPGLPPSPPSLGRWREEGRVREAGCGVPYTGHTVDDLKQQRLSSAARGACAQGQVFLSESQGSEVCRKSQGWYHLSPELKAET